MSQLNGRLRYLRVSLLNSSNLSCFYCKPTTDRCRQASTADTSVLTEAIATLHRFGVRKVRFTGGEPTLHKELTSLVRATKGLSEDMFCAVTTNGLLLQRLAEPLAEGGLDSVNVSIDTLQPEKFKQITGVDGVARVTAGIRAAVGVIPEVKLNCVVMKGINDDEAAELVALANDLRIDIRFIEYMPTRGNVTQQDLYVPGDTIRASLPYIFTPLPGPQSAAARYYGAPDLRIRVGFINPVSHSFCAHCDRIRLTSDGYLYGCLFSAEKVNLFDHLGRGSNSVHRVLQQILDGKRFLGCIGAGESMADLPSFVDMGG